MTLKNKLALLQFDTRQAKCVIIRPGLFVSSMSREKLQVEFDRIQNILNDIDDRKENLIKEMTNGIQNEIVSLVYKYIEESIEADEKCYNEIWVSREKTMEKIQIGKETPNKRMKKTKETLEREETAIRDGIKRLEYKLKKLNLREWNCLKENKDNPTNKDACETLFRMNKGPRIFLLKELTEKEDELDKLLMAGEDDKFSKLSRCVQLGLLRETAPSAWQEEHLKKNYIHFTDAAPIEMYFKGFGNFRNYIETGNELLKDNRLQEFIINSNRLLLKVTESADGKFKGMSETYEKEVRDIVGECLSRPIVKCALPPREKSSGRSQTGQPPISDGYVMATSEKGYLFHLEIKKAFDMGVFQSFGYYHQYSSIKIRDFGNTCQPSVLFCINAYTIFVYGGVFDVFDEISIQALTGPIDLTKNEAFKDVAVLFYSLQALLEDLNKFYSYEASNPPPKFPVIHTSGILEKIIDTTELMPDIMKEKLTETKRRSNESQVVNRIMPVMYKTKYQTEDKTEVEAIIKFTRSYGIDIHKFCAEVKLAPEVLHHEENGTYHVIIYRYIQGDRLTIKDEDTWVKEKLESLLKKLKEKKFVHGDIRRPNILINKEDNILNLIDYDWSGIENINCYPSHVNPLLTWHRDVKRGHVLKTSHDEFMMNKLFVE